MTPNARGPLLLLRVDVSYQHGTGHLMRCKALGDAWIQAGGRAEFVTASDLSPYAAWLGDWLAHRLASTPGTLEDAAETLALAHAMGAAWVTADGYHFDAGWQQVFAGQRDLLLLDDYGHGAPHTAAAVLNQNPGAAESLYSARAEETRLLLGPRFALLRRQFTPWRKWRRATSPQGGRVLVTFGGVDPAGVTLAAVEALRGLPLQAEVVVGAGNPHAAEIEARCAGTNLRVLRHVLDMPDLMAECDLALGASGSTTLEMAFLQLPQILITVADNQLLLAAALAKSGAAAVLGWHTGVSLEAIRAAVQALAGDDVRRKAMSLAARQLVDGFGAERVVTHLRARSLQLRRVDERDERRTWEWANDPAARAAFFSSNPIPWEEHRDWFARQWANPQARLFIGEDPGSSSASLGLIRFALAGAEADVSVVLAPAARGRGYAAPLILRGSQALLREGAVRRLHAYIKPENSASRAAFLRAGYRPQGLTAMHGHQAVHYALEAGDFPAYECA